MPRRKQGRSQESAEGEPSETSESPPADSAPKCSSNLSDAVTDESQSITEAVVVRRRKTGVVSCPTDMPALVHDIVPSSVTCRLDLRIHSDSLLGGAPIVSLLPTDDGKVQSCPLPDSPQPSLSALGSVYGFKSSNIETVLNGLSTNAKRPSSERSKSFSGILDQVCHEEFGSVTRASSLHTLSGYAITRPPKLTNPQVIEQHISKIISENAAIVETLNPLWSKRYMRQNGDVKTRRMSEGSSGFPSKLHSALLGKCEAERRSPLRESVVKNLLCSQPAVPTEETCKQHPNNPEGSIIKDLLLKARAQQKDECDASDIEPGQVVYTCSLCNITYRSRENLDVHQAHYCKGSRSSVPVSKRSSSFSYPGFFPREEPGQILKKQLLGTSPQAEEPCSPRKIRKISEPVFPSPQHSASSENERGVTFSNLYWHKTNPSPPGGGNSIVSSAGRDVKDQTQCNMVVNIAKPVLNSGGTLVRPAQSFVPRHTDADSVIVTFPNEKPCSELPEMQPVVLSKPSSREQSSVSVNMTIPEVHLIPSSPDPPVSDSQPPVSQCESGREPTKNMYLSPARPTSLPLKKKAMTMEYSTIVSPETPRPKRNCIQMYLNGQAYTSLYLKCSTRTTYCCLRPPQPMYVLQQPKLSMYSNWQVQPAREELNGLSPTQIMALYDSQQQHRHRSSITTCAASKAPLVSTHSSYWTFRQQEEEQKDARGEVDKLRASLEEPSVAEKLASAGDSSEVEEGDREDDNDRPDLGMEKDSGAEDQSLTCTSNSERQGPEYESTDNLPEGDSELSEGGSSEDSGSESQRGDKPAGTRSSSKRVRIFQGGYKTNEDYTYIRGRGRGKYVCEECGIRCKKPSMLKKHIRTHTDLRPYSCSHCSFAFKTKGNLTKHMKSKAHHKKCLELGIVPVPTVIDDSQIDEAAVAQQVANRQQFLDAGGIEDEEEDDDEDFDEDEEEEEESEFEEEEKEQTTNTKESRENSGEAPKAEVSCKPTAKKESGGQFEDASSNSVLAPCPADASVPTTSIVVSQSVCSSNSTSSSQLKGQKTDQEAEAARSLLNLSDSWIAQKPTDVQKTEESVILQESPTPVPLTTQSLVSVPLASWATEEDHGPKSRPRSYSVNVPPSHDPHTKVINYALPPVSEDSAREGPSRRYSLSALSESRRVLNSPSSSSMYTRGVLSSEKNPNPKDSERYDKHWQIVNGGEQPMDLRVVKTPRLMLLTPQQTLWNSSSVMLSTLNERPSRSTAIESPGFGLQFTETSASSSEYMSPLSLNRFSPNNCERMNVEVFPVKENDNVNGDVVETAASPEGPEYSALSPISPASVDGDSQICASAVEEVSNMSVMDSNAEMSSRASYARLNNSKMDEGKCVCSICNKTFSKPSQLRLHVNIHYFERPFRCESCAVSFRTKGHLQKHKRSVSHYNKVNMNMTFGTPTTDNPRPFKCGDCKIAFRIHGHLAKHLRSKMHIMKLECLGKLPFGMYAEMERSGVNLNEIDTTDCENSLESLQVMAHRLYQQDPRRMRWQSDQQGSATSKDERVLHSPSALPASHGSSDEALPSPPRHTSTRVPLVTPPTVSTNHTTAEVNPKTPLKVHEVKVETSEEEILRLVQRVQDDYGPPPTKMTVTDLSRMVTVEKELDIPALHRSCTCHLCGRIFKSVKFLQVHLHYEHQGWSGPSSSGVDMTTAVVEEAVPQQPQHWVAPVECNQRLLGGSATVVDSLSCEICGRQFASRTVLQQHLVSHAQLRPFVCEVCDAGFTSSVMLSAHLATHSQEKPYMCHECGNTFAAGADFQRHMQAHLNDAT